MAQPLSLKPVPNVISSPTLIVADYPSVIVIASDTSQVGFLPNVATTVDENTWSHPVLVVSTYTKGPPKSTLIFDKPLRNVA